VQKWLKFESINSNTKESDVDLLILHVPSCTCKEDQAKHQRGNNKRNIFRTLLALVVETKVAQNFLRKKKEERRKKEKRRVRGT
tara:strand:- start:199 stop:450 length:252 start_codon:yes stop_codon:yes gene_type:complete